MKQQIANVVDNAMLYKDITQWLRNKTFLFLFIGLLGVAEVVTIFVTLMPETEDDVGSLSFIILSTILIIYGLIIAFLGHNLTSREFFNRTFELYELSGMSLEGMVWGKMLSMLSQFLFGYFCIVPFMFVAFLLGGLDFYVVITTTIVTVLVILPMYLVALFIALLSKIRHLSNFIRGIMLVFMFLVLPWWGIAFFFEMVYGGGGGGGGGPVELLKQILALNWDAIQGVLIFLGFYIQVLMLLYFLCCNAISPKTDSRTTAVKLMAFLLSLSYLAMFTISIWYNSADHKGYVAIVPIMILFLVIGMASFFGRMDIPIMAEKRKKQAKWWTKIIYYWFEPGAFGALKTLLLFYLLMLAFYVMTIVFTPRGHNIHSDFKDALAIGLQTPYFLAFPAFLLFYIKKLSRNIAAIRAGVMIWWILTGLPLMILGLFVRFESQGFNNLTAFIISFLAFLASPVSSVFVDTEAVRPIRVILGILGLLALVRIYFHRRKIERRIEPKRAEA
ncbi:MAG: hypothetical protein ACLFUS_07305 [Candidatus Sumerlaeia bacterium]